MNCGNILGSLNRSTSHVPSCGLSVRLLLGIFVVISSCTTPIPVLLLDFWPSVLLLSVQGLATLYGKFSSRRNPCQKIQSRWSGWLAEVWNSHCSFPLNRGPASTLLLFLYRVLDYPLRWPFFRREATTGIYIHSDWIAARCVFEGVSYRPDSEGDSACAIACQLLYHRSTGIRKSVAGPLSNPLRLPRAVPPFVLLELHANSMAQLRGYHPCRGSCCQRYAAFNFVMLG